MLRFLKGTLIALLIASVSQAAPQNSQYPDNYSVYVRAIQHGDSGTPGPYGAPPDSGSVGHQSGGYSPPLAPQGYRPPLQSPHPQSQGPYGGQASYSFPQQPVPSAQTPAPVAPQVRPFPQYQPPLLPPYNPPSVPQQPQIHQAAAPAQPQQPALNNQQLIYVGGQQRQYNSPPASAPLPAAPLPTSSRQASASSAAGQPVSFSTSFTSDQANRQSKVVGSAQQAPAQAIQKAPASEIQFDKKVIAAKDKDGNKKDDEYVIYYYYYYDEKDKKNLTLNFDDIPNLEQYDKENKTSRASHVVSGVPNSLQSNRAPLAPAQTEFHPTQSPRSATAVSVSVSVSEGPHQVSPISNVYRYGGGEIPRSPILKPTPEVHLREPLGPTHGLTPDSLGNTVSSSSDPRVHVEVSSVAPTVAVGPETPAESNLEKPAEDINDVGDSKTDVKKAEATEAETTTTSTETSTTEEASTTTEAPKRGSGFGNRRRFGGPSRVPPTRRPTSASTVNAAEAAPTSTTRRPNPLNRQRPRRPVGESTRIRPTRPRRPIKEETTPEEDEEHKEEAPSTTTQASTTAGSRRFGSNTRSRYQPTRSERTTTARPSVSPRTRPTRPATGLARTRPTRPRGRPAFGRTKAPEEEETKEETSSSTTLEEPSKSSDSPSTSESPVPASPAPEEAPETHSEDGETAEQTSTEPSRRNPLLRPRSRNPLFGNRPRANLANRGQASK